MFANRRVCVSERDFGFTNDLINFFGKWIVPSWRKTSYKRP